MKKPMITLVSVLTALNVLTACAGGANPSAKATPDSSAAPSTTSTGPVNLTFWHAMGGANEEVVKKVAQTFNETVGKEKGIVITPVFQGSYGDLMKKVRAAVQAKDVKNLPDIVQSPASETAYMKDIPYVVPAQTLADQDASFRIADLEPNVVASFSYNGKLIGVPFANSTILLYYNKNLFKEAGLNPEQPPVTIDELGQVAAKLTKKNGAQASQWGFSGTPDLYHLSSWIGMQGGYIGNNKNGRANTMTAVEFDSNGTMKKFMTEWKKAVAYGGIQTGTDTNQNEEFAAGKLAMFVNSTAGLKGVLNAVGGKFEVGTAFLPKVDAGDKGGVAVGGSALYTMDRGDKAKIDAAREYMKYSTSAETQFVWHSGTGYFPVNLKTYDLPDMKAHLDKNPLFKTAINQLHASSPDTQEPMNAVSSEISTAMKEEILGYVTDKKDIDKAIATMVTRINKALADYNRANGKN